MRMSYPYLIQPQSNCWLLNMLTELAALSLIPCLPSSVMLQEG
jgi:hypothetical protein